VAQPVLLLDGGMGQELIHRSTAQATHHWSLQVMMDEPHLVTEVHREFCEAGADIACLNTYAVTRARLARGQNLPTLEALLRNAYELAKQGTTYSGKTNTPLIAALPPLVASYRAETQLPIAQMIEEYQELIDLQKSRVDGFLAETIPSITEATAVLTAADQAGVRIMLGFTVSDDDGKRLRSGEPLAEALEAIESYDPVAILINCSKPEAASQAMPMLAQSRFIFGAFANGFTAIDALEPGGVVDVLQARKDLSPVQYAKFATEWLDAGATVIGGCCEVGPEHIKALDELLLSRGHKKLTWQELAA
jgi:S-methylmethionine-dependent homocysteine/selenocysteine methylase